VHRVWPANEEESYVIYAMKYVHLEQF